MKICRLSIRIAYQVLLRTSVLSEYGLYELSTRYVRNRGASRHLRSNTVWEAE